MLGLNLSGIGEKRTETEKKEKNTKKNTKRNRKATRNNTNTTGRILKDTGVECVGHRGQQEEEIRKGRRRSGREVNCDTPTLKGGQKWLKHSLF